MYLGRQPGPHTGEHAPELRRDQQGRHSAHEPRVHAVHARAPPGGLAAALQHDRAQLHEDNASDSEEDDPEEEKSEEELEHEGEREAVAEPVGV